MPKISIILPIYNVGVYLDETFKALVNQTFRDIEIIAVNDGSTDNSQEFIDKYQQQDNRISSIRQENSGQSAARNRAIEQAKGDYLFFMDSDDTIDTDALRLCYEYAERTNADFIFFDGDILQEPGTAKIPWNYKRTHLLRENCRYEGEFLLRLMLDKQKHNCVVWLLFIRRSYLEHIKLRFYEGIIHEDELFTTILTLSSRNIYCLRKSLVQHRVRGGSTMGHRYSKRNINCYLTVVDELLRFQHSPIIHQFARYTLSKVFYTGHIIPFKEKPSVFWRALRSGYLKYIGLKSILVFFLKST